MLDLKHLVSSKKSKEQLQIEAYQSAVAKNPENVAIRLKLGDLYAKVGDKAAAIQEYTTVALEYAKEGYLVKAIAVNKLIVRLDPARQEALDRLSDLYFQRGITADPLVESYRKQKGSQMISEEPAAEASEELPTIEPEEPEEELTFEPEEMIDLEAPTEAEEPVTQEVSFATIPLLANITDDTQRWLKRHVVVREYDKGQTIVEHENTQQSLFLVSAGQVKLVTKDKEGQDTVLNLLATGAFFGGMTLFKPVRQGQDSAQENDITVVAAEACTILEITHDDVLLLKKREPEVSDALLDEYYKRRAADVTLARVPLFSYLDPLERNQIAQHLTPLHVSKDETIITEGEEGDTMYLIKSGEVGIYTTLMEEEGVSVIKSNQNRLHLATLKAGDFFGEQALITKEPRNATIIALTDVELLQFSKHDLATVVRQYPRVGTLLKKYHQQRVAETMESLKSIW